MLEAEFDKCALDNGRKFGDPMALIFTVPNFQRLAFSLSLTHTHTWPRRQRSMNQPKFAWDRSMPLGAPDGPTRFNAARKEVSLPMMRTGAMPTALRTATSPLARLDERARRWAQKSQQAASDGNARNRLATRSPNPSMKTRTS